MLRSWLHIILILVCGTLTGFLLFFLWRISDGTEFRRVDRNTIPFEPLAETRVTPQDTATPELPQDKTANGTENLPATGNAKPGPLSPR